jgi:hypothetical protein
MPDQSIVDDGDPGSDQLLKTRLLETVSQLTFTLQLAKASTVVCQDVYLDLIAFVRTRLFEICHAKVGLLAYEIDVISLPNLQQIFNSELEATHPRSHLERARLAKPEKRIQRKHILDEAPDRLEAWREAFLSRYVHSTEPPIDPIPIPPDADLCVSAFKCRGKSDIFTAYEPELIALSRVPWNQK